MWALDGTDVQWKCEAELLPNLRFGETTVMCEVRSPQPCDLFTFDLHNLATEQTSSM